jgi:fructose-specific phosphotransferase system component IIB
MLLNVTQKIVLEKLQSDNLEMGHRVKVDISGRIGIIFKITSRINNTKYIEFLNKLSDN